ncbi:MAG: tetratricopeptide repeat protein [Ignavibacterium sp.]|uniref:tetratricopeptide repeat protein n=1 Tax=Ignavibacterium sp. TaxID=2651167 RepID=UPI003296C0E7
MTGLLALFRNIFSTFLILTVSLSAQSYPDSKVDELLRKGIDKIINQNYDDAKKIFSELDKVRNDIPLGKIYLAATEIAKSYDYELPYNHNLITDYLELAKSISKKLIEKDKKNIWNKYFLALTEGYIAYYDAIRGSWLQAISTGLNSISLFEDILETDSSFHDAYIAIGTFKYWKSAKTEFLNWLPFVDDEKDLGIKFLTIAVKNSSYNYHLAVNSLIWIYIDRERFGDAIELAEKALIKYPESRIFRWGLARAYEDIDTQKAINEYFKVLNSFPDTLKSNNINEVTLKHIIAQQYYKIGKKSEAKKLCEEILKIRNYSDYEKDKLEKRLKRVQTLYKELNSY